MNVRRQISYSTLCIPALFEPKHCNCICLMRLKTLFVIYMGINYASFREEQIYIQKFTFHYKID